MDILSSKSLDLREKAKYRMLQANTWQRKKDPRLLTWNFRRLIALLFIFAFFTSGLAHVVTGDPSASAESPSYEIGALGHASSGEQPCAGAADEAHGATCCIASFCSFCVPLPSSAAMTRTTVAEVVVALPDGVHHGLTTPPGIRPPSFSESV